MRIEGRFYCSVTIKENKRIDIAINKVIIGL